MVYRAKITNVKLYVKSDLIVMKKPYIIPHLSWDVFRVPMCFNFENRVKRITEYLQDMLKDRFYFEVPDSVPLLEIYDWIREENLRQFLESVCVCETK